MVIVGIGNMACDAAVDLSSVCSQVITSYITRDVGTRRLSITARPCVVGTTWLTWLNDPTISGPK